MMLTIAKWAVSFVYDQNYDRIVWFKVQGFIYQRIPFTIRILIKYRYVSSQLWFKYTVFLWRIFDDYSYSNADHNVEEKARQVDPFIEKCKKNPPQYKKKIVLRKEISSSMPLLASNIEAR